MRANNADAYREYINWFQDTAFGSVLNDVAKIPETIAEPQKLLCRKPISSYTNEDEGQNAAFIDRDSGIGRSLQAGIMLNSRAYPPAPQSDDMYIYELTYSVGAETDSPFRFRGLLINESQGTEKIVVPNQQVQQVGRGYFGARGRSPENAHEELWEKFCLKFDQDMRDFYDQTLAGFEEGGTLFCQDVMLR